MALSLTVLPWTTTESGASAAGPEIWRALSESDTTGFGGWYVLLFSYPLAALGILLALVTVFESVAMKVIWAGLTLVGLGVLVLRYGLGPFAGMGSGDGALDFTTQEITTAVIAVAALVLVIFMLRTAVVMFRRIAGLVLLALAAVHIAAVRDLADGAELSIGAYGSAVGYLLAGVAAFIGPRRFLPLA